MFAANYPAQTGTISRGAYVWLIESAVESFAEEVQNRDPLIRMFNKKLDWLQKQWESLGEKRFYDDLEKRDKEIKREVMEKYLASTDPELINFYSSDNKEFWRQFEEGRQQILAERAGK